jgi:cell surface protein SprA
VKQYRPRFERLKAAPLFLFCFSVFFYFYALVPDLSAQESAEDVAAGSSLGLRLPDIRSLDPRVFPFEATPSRGLSLRGEPSPLFDWQPLSLRRRTAIDSTKKAIAISEEMNGLPIRWRYKIPLETYLSERLAYDRSLAWQRAATEMVYRLSDDQRRGPGGVNIEIPVPIKSKAFEQIFGGSTVGLNVQGDISIKGGFRRETRDETQTAYNRGPQNTFKMSQTQRFTVTGRIGEKVTVNVDQDSERAFEFENNIKLNYTGFEDDIVQRIDAGNVALSLPGTRFVTYGGTSAGLFGVKTEMQIGNLAVTAIASQEKGENKKLTLSGGAEEGGRKIKDYEYRRYTYFFLDARYREQYRYYASKWVHQYDVQRIFNKRGSAIYRIQVYKSWGSPQENPNVIPGVAYRDPKNPAAANPESPDSTEVFRRRFIRLEPNIDYYLEKTLGYIVMTNPLSVDEVLAVAYEDSGRFYGGAAAAGIVGDIDYDRGSDPTNPKSIVLKLIKPPSPVPSRDSKHTWQLEWKNVYDLGARNIPAEDFQNNFQLKIYYQPPSGAPQETQTDTLQNGQQRSLAYLNILGLDVRDNAGRESQTGDGFIDNDPAIIDLRRGELIFPDLEPFEPDGIFINNNNVADPSNLKKYRYIPTIYQSNIPAEIYRDSRFHIEVKFKNRISNTYSLGFNVIEGSEEVLLDGRRLQRDTDYNIDYFSGNLVILNPEATKPGRNLEISYQGNQLFQLEKKTIIGSRAEYRFNPNSFIGGTFLYLNQTTLDQRVRLGSVDSGPMRNLIWDVNTALRFQPNFLTRALDALPFLSAQEPSELRFEGEIAQILPNPNTIDSKIPEENRIPGDKDGVAFIDDFEASKRTTPLGVNRRGWVQASIPQAILNDPRTPKPPDNLDTLRIRGALARRGKLLWYNPFRGRATQEIYPNKRDDQIDAGNATTQVMIMTFAPHDTLNKAPYNLSVADSWGGIMRALSPGFYDQNESKFIEIWLNGTRGRVHIDLGQISEDMIPNVKAPQNKRLNTEDTQGGIRNGLLDDGEDIGLDGVDAKDPADYWEITGNNQRDWGEPISFDDWFYLFENERDRYDTGAGTVNGTEDSKKDGTEGGGTIRPDTEDINNNGDVDLVNNYFSYTFDLDTSSTDIRYFQGGNKNGWKLYRIPLADGKKEGDPSLSRVEYVRLWVDGFKSTKRDSIMIADISLAGNEWKEVGVGRGDPVFVYNRRDPRLEVTVINTDENPEYTPPKNILGEIDRVRNIRAKEQSQVIRVRNLKRGDIAVAQKTFIQPLSLINYKRVKMFVYGKNVTPSDHIEFFIRFGADSSNYYEFRQRLFPERADREWDDRNVMDLSLIDLATFKLNTTQRDTTKMEELVKGSYYRLGPEHDATLRQAIGLQPHQEIRVRGNPALTNVRTLIAGLQNVAGKDFETPFSGEIWMDELRVTHVKKDKGIAMRARFDLKLADFITVGGEINRKDADFHNVAERFGQGNDERAYSFNGSMTLDRILPQSLGLAIPVSMTYTKALATPKYVPGSDIQVINNPLIAPIKVTGTDKTGKTTERPIKDAIRTDNKSASVNFSVRRRARSNNFFIKNTLDNLSGSVSYTYAKSQNAQLAISRRIAWSGDASYNLTFGNKNFVEPFKWIGKAPLLGKLTNTKLYYSPQNFSAQLQTQTSRDTSLSQILDPQTYRIRYGVPTRVSSHTATYNYRTSMKVLENLSADFSRAFNNDLRTAAHGRKKERYYLLGLVTGNNKLLSLNQTFGAKYSPNLFSWFNPSLSYNSNFRFANNIQQGDIGRSAGTSTTFTANGNLRFAEIFSFLKRKESPSGGETPERRRPAPRLPPGQQREDNPDEDDEEHQPPPPDDEPKKGKEDKNEKKTKKDDAKSGISPAQLLSVFTKFKDVGVNFTRNKNWSNYALADSSLPWRYQLGLTRNPESGLVSGVTTRPADYQQRDSYSLSSGFDVSRNFNITLRFTHDESRNESTTKTGSTSQSRLGGKKMKLPVAGEEGIPFPEWSITWSGLERLKPFKNFATSMSLSHGFGGKRSQIWNDRPDKITSEDFSFNFQPLLQVNLTWKNGMVSTFKYSKTTGDRPTYIYTFDNQEGAELRQPQGSTITRNNDLSFTTTYSKQSGFRLPLPFLKNKELRNSIDLSVTYQRNVSESAQTRGADEEEIGGQKTTRWSLSPRLTYSFSNRVRGGAFYETGVTDSKQSGKIKVNELGIEINISIRGE